jgi:uncharacterized protein
LPFYGIVAGFIAGKIHHGPWPLQSAEAEFQKNPMATAAGIALPDGEPRVDSSPRMKVLIWPLSQLL